MKTLLGLLLVPFCFAVTRTLWFMIEGLRTATGGEVAISAWSLLAGFLIWIFCYFTMSRPLRTYVLGHELTHALWGFLMGASIHGFKVSKKGGHVEMSKQNFFITLAPYFFPLYTVLVILIYAGLLLFMYLSIYEPFWLGCVGLTWGFHFTFTMMALTTRQPDIERYGRVLSYAIIYFMNVLGMCMWIAAVASPTFEGMVEQFVKEVAGIWQWGLHTVGGVIGES